jgi:uncharacterized protein
MKIIISEIPDNGLDIEVNETLAFDAGSFPVQAQLKIKKVGTEIVINGNILTAVELQCSRCLKDFKRKFSFPFEAIFHPIEQLKEEEKHELDVEELDMGFYAKDELDLFDIIKEQVMLNLPMKALCNDFCKGICLRCGADLNAGDCSCSKKDIDPRLVSLKKFLNKET